MKNTRKKTRLRSVMTWIGWALLLQLVLINISAALYADKLTHLYAAPPGVYSQEVSKNIFARTWRLFSGIRFYKQAISDRPGFPYSTIVLKSTDSLAIESWYAQPVDSMAKGTVILFHGLMGNKGQVLPEAAAFREMGYNVMLVDVRAHGNSEGEVITIGYREAKEVELAVKYIMAAGEKNIYLWGASMGAVEIIRATAEYALPVSGIIAEMPFGSLQSHLKGRARILGFPEQPFGFLTSFWIGVEQGFNGWGYRTATYGKKLQCPVLMQYGAKDALVTRAETDAVFGSIASTNKKLVIYEQAGHEKLMRSDPVLWRKEVSSFLGQPVTF